MIEEITNQFGLTADNIVIHNSGREGLQLRMNGIDSKIFDPKLKSEFLEIDLGFYPKSKLDIYLSHTAVEEKLANIEKNYGTETKNEVIANILLLKKMLKENEIYKRQDGGLTGIGTENLILKFGGNLESVFETILKNSKDSNNNIVSVTEFRQKMILLDAGTNVRDMNHDDYFANLTESSFEKLINLIQKYQWN